MLEVTSISQSFSQFTVHLTYINSFNVLLLYAKKKYSNIPTDIKVDVFFLTVWWQILKSNSYANPTLWEPGWVAKSAYQLGYRLDDQEIRVWNSAKARDFSFFHNSQTFSWALSDSYTMGMGGWRAVSPGAKQHGCEAEHAPLSSVEVKNFRAQPPLPPQCLMAWWLITSAKGQLCLYLIQDSYQYTNAC
jgi:hypothetical protein